MDCTNKIRSISNPIEFLFAPCRNTNSIRVAIWTKSIVYDRSNYITSTRDTIIILNEHPCPWLMIRLLILFYFIFKFCLPFGFVEIPKAVSAWCQTFLCAYCRTAMRSLYIFGFFTSLIWNETTKMMAGIGQIFRRFNKFFFSCLFTQIIRMRCALYSLTQWVCVRLYKKKW